MINNKIDKWNNLRYKYIPIFLRDTLSFRPFSRNKVINAYICGPTVYRELHIGNIRTIYFSNIFKNICKFFYFKKLNFIMNITDIDDKILDTIRVKKIIFKDFIDKISKICINQLKDFNSIDSEIKIVYVTKNIDKILNFISLLEEKNLIIKKQDGLYCKIINKLYNHKELKNNIDNSYSQEFCVWKFKKPGEEITWISKWGEGRPGWHLECYVLSFLNLKGDKILHLHFGGKDLRFPHNHNELYLYKLLSNDYIEHQTKFYNFGLLVNPQGKMSKKKNNVIFLKKQIIKLKNHEKINNFNLYKIFFLNNNIFKDQVISEDLVMTNIKKLVKINYIFSTNSFKDNMNEEDFFVIYDYLLTNICNLRFGKVIACIIKLSSQLKKKCLSLNKKHKSLLKEILAIFSIKLKDYKL